MLDTTLTLAMRSRTVVRMFKLTAAMVVLLAGSACTKASDPELGAARSAGKDARMQSYSVLAVPTKTSVTVEMDTPADWTVTTNNGDPEFTIPGVKGGTIALAALAANAAPDQRMKDAISAQYGDGSGAERSDLPDGRVWMQRHEARVDHIRMFVPYDQGIVMAVAMVRHEYAAQLPMLRKVFETLRVATAPAPAR